MLAYVFRRILEMIPTLFVLATLTFFLLRLAPGGPFDAEQVWPPEIQANILHQYGLDLPLTTQYGNWLKALIQGDLKESFQYIDRPVLEIISETLPISLFLGVLAVIVSILIGISLGCLAAWKRDTWLDRILMIFAISGLSLPSYLLASLLILFFSLHLGWLPPALWEGPSTWILPTFTLAWRPIGIIARMTRTTLIEELMSDYVRTAYGKGASASAVVFKHTLKNSLIPVISVLGPLVANLITGSFLVEVIFQIPGMGKYFVQAVLNRDYPLVMGVTLTYGVILIGSNLCVDLLYGWADPRVRLEAKAE
jgi:oligopeptide transport system permease protein